MWAGRTVIGRHLGVPGGTGSGDRPSAASWSSWHQDLGTQGPKTPAESTAATPGPEAESRWVTGLANAVRARSAVLLAGAYVNVGRHAAPDRDDLCGCY